MSQSAGGLAQRDYHLSGDRKVTVKGDYLTVDWLTALKQRLERRLLYSPGALYHRPEFGAGLNAYLNKVIGTRQVREIQARVRQQCAREPLVSSIDQVDVEAGDDNSLLVTLYCTAANQSLRLPLVVR